MSSDLTSDLLQFNFKMPKGSKNGVFSFDRFELDAEKLMLYRDGLEITLAPKIVKTLAVLIENRGSILSKDELIDKVWDDSIVEESNLSQNLYILRKTLGTKPDGGQYIETLRRRGYRFNADVTSHPHNEPFVRNDGFLPNVPLIGREKEIAEVVDLIERDDMRILTISGVGGVGKTSLALAVAERFKEEREVFVVELAAITRPELVVSAIASELGVRESSNEPLIDLVKQSVAGRSVLLVLDNFEQVVMAAPILSDLTSSHNDSLRILVTSRVPLRLKAETMYLLPPLQIPQTNGEHVNLADLSNCEAICLFIERARQAQPKFHLTAENAADIASICAQLGGLPLAIELAAARMRFMTADAVLTRLRKQLDFLQGVNRDAPQRQQTMRETIAWSFDLLTVDEKKVFARLGVFLGGFDVRAAEFVCSGSDGDSEVSVLDVITSLVEHNLLTVRNAKNGEPRIYMLEAVREFAEDVLADQEHLQDSKHAHAQYFLHLGEEMEPQLLAARSAESLDRLETEHDNIRAALTWSRENDPAIGQRLAGAIWRFWWLHGHIREACEQLDAFLSISSIDPKTRAKMLVGAAFLNRLAGHSERSRMFAQEGVQLASTIGDLRTGALSLNQLGFLALDIGDFAQAEKMFCRGLQRADELGDIQILALLNNGLGELSRSKGELPKAAEFYGKALEFNRKAGDRVRQTTCLINLGATALMQNDHKSAGSFYRSGLVISSEMEDMNGTLYCLEGIAGSYWAMHDPKRASLIFGAADAGRQANDLLLEPADKVPYERSLTFVREALGTELFNAGIAEGSRMGLKAAISLALEDKEIPEEPASGSDEAEANSFIRGENVVIERQGNVLRLVDWAPSVPSGAETVAPVPQAAPAGRDPRILYGIGVLALILIATTGAALYLYQMAGSTASLERNDLTVTRLTNMNYVRDATISRDGNFFAYNEALSGSSRVWLQQTGKSARVEIIPGGKWQICCKSFSPDGKFLYFYAANQPEKRMDLYRVSTLGGTPEKITNDARGYLSFSPDGQEMLFLRIDQERNERSLIIAPSNGRGGERTILKTDRSPDLLNASWSPDGKRIAFQTFAQTPEPEAGCFLSTLDLQTGTVSRISEERWANCFRMEWLRDGSGIAMVGTKLGETNTARRDQVYLISYPEGHSRRLTTEASRHEPDSLGVTDDGTILAVPFNRSSQIWGMDATGDSRTAFQMTSGVADGRASITPMSDGRVGYIARSGDDLNIWVMNFDGSNQTQVGEATAVQDLAVTPDGKYFYYSNEADGKGLLFRMGADGTDPEQVTGDEEYVIDATVSPDGAWLVYDVWKTSGVDHDVVLKKVPVAGGEPISIRDDNCSVPHVSPNGRYISCVYFNKNQFAVISLADGSKIAEFDTVSFPHLNTGGRWTPDSRALAYIVHQNNICNVWTQPIDGGKPVQLTDFTSGSCYNLAYSHDGSRLYLARGHELRDAVLIRNYK